MFESLSFLRCLDIDCYSATQSISVYVNGALSFNAIVVAALTVADTIMIGGRGNVAYFNGAIDELLFFKIPIGQQHVQLV